MFLANDLPANLLTNKYAIASTSITENYVGIDAPLLDKVRTQDGPSVLLPNSNLIKATLK